MLERETGTDQLVTQIISGIEEVKGQNIEILDLRKIENTVCDYFVICDGTSNTQVNAIVNSIQKIVSKTIKEQPWHVEGSNPINPHKVAHTFGELELVLEAVKRNLGIALLPKDMLTDDIIAISVNGVKPTQRMMNAVYPTRRLLPSRVRMLIDYMSAHR